MKDRPDNYDVMFLATTGLFLLPLSGEVPLHPIGMTV